MCLTTSLTRYCSKKSNYDLVHIVNAYFFFFRLSPAEVFMDLVLTYQAIEKAEKLALVFGLNLQQLLEVAGDLKLSAKEFPQAIALYKVSKVC
jgi:hypothetical protein